MSLPLTRTTFPTATVGKLSYAQVREDPRLEIEALGGTEGTTVVVGSGGCTALSLLGATRGPVVAIDVNPVQNHLLELKSAAVRVLGAERATGFLGGWPDEGRAEAYEALRGSLTAGACAHWDAARDQVAAGVLGVGVTERFVALLARVVRLAVHRPATIDGLLACPDLPAQRAYFQQTWDTWRWRALFALLLNRAVFRNVDPMFFQHVQSDSFSRYFRDKLAHTITELPVADNYFLHFMLTGRYPRTALPPYLSADAEPEHAERLRVVDADLVDWLGTLPEGSVDRFALSNVAEWMPPERVDTLFGEVVRAAAPGARVCFRNFMGWTHIPARWADRLTDTGWGEQAIGRDRSGVQRRIVCCEVR